MSIAKVHGRTRGIGNEFVLACGMRFASRKNALFGNLEIGVGLVPGGGALEWLPRLVGRARALEIVLTRRFRRVRVRWISAGKRAATSST